MSRAGDADHSPLLIPRLAAASPIAADPIIQCEPLLLRRVDAARMLAISPRKLDEWVAAGLIPKWKRDGIVAFALDDLRAFVASNKPKRTAGDGRRPHAPTPLGNGFIAKSV